MARRDPARVVGSEAARGGHAVDMGMMLQPLVPGMEHAEEADLGAEVPGIASDLEQGRGAGDPPPPAGAPTREAQEAKRP